MKVGGRLRTGSIRTRLDHAVVNVFLLLCHHDLHVAEPFLDPRRAAAAARMKPPHHYRAADLGARYHQPVDIELMIVLRIGNGAFQCLADLMRNAPLAEGQRGDRPLRRQIANHRRHQIELARTGAHVAENCLRLVIGERAFMFRLAHVKSNRLRSCQIQSPALMSAPLRLFVAGVTGERAGRRELAEFMARPCSRSPARAGTCDRYGHQTSARRTAAEWSNGATRSG